MVITVNIEKAKEIHKKNIRAFREKKFQELDIQFQRALEEGANTTSIVAKKKELRDLTKHPDLLNASTVEEIKSFWPDILSD